jgi:hypothetical protein
MSCRVSIRPSVICLIVASVVGACSDKTANPPVAPVAPVVPVAPPPPPAAAPAVVVDDASAWAMWTAGRRDDALAAFRKLVASSRGKAKPTSGVASAQIAVSSDGARAVAIAGGAAYWFDTAGAPVAYMPTEATTVEFIPGSWLAMLDTPGLTIVDGATFAPVLLASGIRRHVVSASGKIVAYQEEPAGAPVQLHLWDTTTRSDRRVVALADHEFTFGCGLSPDDKELWCRVPGGADGDHMTIFGEDNGRLDFPEQMFAAPPSFSSDGKWIAYGHAGVGQGAPETVLVARATRKVITSHAVGYPTATEFSKSGKLLIVGQLRALSILEVPSLKVVATTAEMRPMMKMGDDMQNIIDIELIGDDRGFWATTADGDSHAVFRLPSGTLVWKGEVPNLAAIGAKLGVRVQAPEWPGTDTADRAAEKLGAVLEGTVCTAGGRIYPIAACE